MNSILRKTPLACLLFLALATLGWATNYEFSLQTTLSDSTKALIVDEEGNILRSQGTTFIKTSPSGTSQIVCGKSGESGYVDGDATSVRFLYINEILKGPSGSYYVNDGGKYLRQIFKDGSVKTLCSITSTAIASDGPIGSGGIGAARLMSCDDEGTLYAIPEINVSLETFNIMRLSTAGLFSSDAFPGLRELLIEKGSTYIRGFQAQADGSCIVNTDQGLLRYTKDVNISVLISYSGSDPNSSFWLSAGSRGLSLPVTI